MSRRAVTDWRRRAGNVSAVVLGLVAVVGLMAVAVQATPMSNGTDANGNPKTALKFPAGSTINIYIEADASAPPDRSALLKEGMDRWVSEMAARGITVNVTVGAVPNPPPSNLVEVTFEPDGTQLGGHTLGTGEGQNDGIGACYDDGTKLDGGKIIIRDGLAAGTDAEKEYLRNLGQHEVTHVLGLADDAAGEVTNHEQGTTANTFNTTDKSEISQLYPLTGQDSAQATGIVVPSGDLLVYDWDFTYDGLESDHVALILLHIEPDLVVDIIPPPGWIALNPADPAHYSLDYPFYEGYAEDWTCDQPLWSLDYTAPVALRALTEEATLSSSNPVVHVALIAQNAERGTIDAWAGGDVQTIEGPVAASGSPIPTVSEWGLIVLALLVLTAATILFRRRSVPRYSS